MFLDLKIKNSTGLKTRQWGILMTLGMLIAALPGFFLSSYSINVVDEPYQIVNAMDWQNAVYSPLSCWLANKFGHLVSWKYLSFRYLSVSLNFMGIFIPAIYTLHASKRKKLVTISAIITTLLALSFKNITHYYGWDNWTTCCMSFSIVLFISLIQKFTWCKLIGLGVAIALTSLMRIPNISTVVFSIIVLAYSDLNKRVCVYRITIFVSVFIISLLVVLKLLYGDIAIYFEAFSVNKIADHSIGHVIKPLVLRFFLAVMYACFLSLSYWYLKFIHRFNIRSRVWLYLLLLVALSISILPSRGFTFGMGPAFCLGLVLLSLFILIRQSKFQRNRRLFLVVSVLFLFSLGAGVGSNGGYSKALIWPLFPLIIWLFGYKFRGVMKELFISCAISYCVFSVIGITNYNFLDEKLSRLTFTFKDEDTVLNGMRTNPERGEFIMRIYKDSKPFLINGYTPIVLKQGNDYIYEYIMMSPNKYQRHTFSNWWAFWDKKYVNSIQKEIKNSKQPIFVLYRQWIDPENITPMLKMLQENTKCVVNEPGYSIWIKDTTLQNSSSLLLSPAGQ